MEERGPWRVRSANTTYENPWIRVDHHDVVTPGGTDGIYGVVHFKNYAVGIIPLDADNNTWLVGQYRFALQRYSWEIPEGGAPVAGSPLESAQRELREEVGLGAKRWDLILEMDLSNSVCDERALVYVARDLHRLTPEPEDTEELELRKLPFAELYAEVLRGDHQDSITVAGVLKCKLLLDAGTI